MERDAEAGRAVRSGSCRRRGGERETVHGGVGKGRNLNARAEGFAEDTPERLPKWDGLRLQLVELRQDTCPGVFHR
jgi:hypothetical protein